MGKRDNIAEKLPKTTKNFTFSLAPTLLPFFCQNEMALGINLTSDKTLGALSIILLTYFTHTIFLQSTTVSCDTINLYRIFFLRQYRLLVLDNPFLNVCADLAFFVF